MIASMTFMSPDSTEIINGITKDILPKGVYAFPETNWIVAGSDLQVVVNSPWVVRSADGMTIREDSVANVLTLPGIGTYYIGLDAQYLVASDPKLELRAILKTDYDAMPASSKAIFIKFALVVATGSSQLTVYTTERDMPRGTLALSADMLNLGSSTVVRVINTTTDFPLDFRPFEIVYVISENAFYIRYGNSWLNVDNQVCGSANFTPNSGALGYEGTVINLPQSLHNRSYFVLVTPSSDSQGHIGEFWVERGANSFAVKVSGTSSASFDWVIARPRPLGL